MSAANINFFNVSFTYTTSDAPVLSSVNFHFSKGWTAVAGPNGSGKSTVAKLAAGMLTPSSGFISSDSGLNTFYCEQETSFIPERAPEFIYSEDTFAGKLRSQLEICQDWADRWNTLSHGERKRLQSGIALWTMPEVLILDEPANHIDEKTKKILSSALMGFEGIGILISHDRDLLDCLCTSTVFIRPGYAMQRQGNYSSACEQQKLEDDARERESLNATGRYRKIRKSAASMKQKETARGSKLSKRNIDRNDHDSKEKVDRARLTGKDKTGSRKAKILEKRAEKEGKTASEVYFKQRKIEGIEFTGERSRSDRLFMIEKKILPLGNSKYLEIPESEILPHDRIAITGENGSGKSTLVKHIVSMTDIDPEKMIYIPQEIDSVLWKKIKGDLDALERKNLGAMFTAVHRLGSEPERVISSSMPSPGEKRKIMLAMGLLKNPHIIILDEPTNHMDISSIEALEAALNLYKGALIIVSHDMRFTGNTCEKRWNFTGEGRGGSGMRCFTAKCSYL